MGRHARGFRHGREPLCSSTGRVPRTPRGGSHDRCPGIQDKGPHVASRQGRPRFRPTATAGADLRMASPPVGGGPHQGAWPAPCGAGPTACHPACRGVPDLRLQDVPVPARPKPAHGPLGGEVAVEPPLGGAEGEVTRRCVVGLIPMPRPIRLTVPGCGAAWGDFSGAHLPGSRVVTQREGRRPVDAGGMTDVDGPGAGR